MTPTEHQESPPLTAAGRLLTAVEAAILNLQHNRISAAVAGLRTARDLTLADRDRRDQRDGPPGLDVAEIATLRKALAIGFVSYDGDSWYAKDAGYEYDDSEQTLTAAREILARLAATRTPKEADPNG